MFCLNNFDHNGYICSTEYKHQFPRDVIQLTQKQTQKQTQMVTQSIPPMTDAEMVFAYASLYILFPLLYIIISTGSITPLTMIWNFLTSGIFRTFVKIQEYLSDFVYAFLRATGQYSFSTYTVVQNGREIYTASSLCYNYPSDRISVYKIDRAKYNVCKWIDAQCELYRRQYNGDEPEVSASRNDIYDFILHKVDGQPYTRIHRGNFTGQTNTLNYKPFVDSYKFVDSVALAVTMPASDDSADAKTETFVIQLKHPNHFFVEKNEILDKKFLQWKMYNENKRKDIANYIGMPFSTYSVILYYNESMKSCATTDTTPSRYTALSIDNTNFVLIGKQYVVKVDSVLRCPIFDSNDQQVYDIDGILTQYYSESEGGSDSDSDSEASEASDSASEATEAAKATEAEETAKATEAEEAAKASEATEAEEAIEAAVDPEFEILEEDKEAR